VFIYQINFIRLLNLFCAILKVAYTIGARQSLTLQAVYCEVTVTADKLTDTVFLAALVKYFYYSRGKIHYFGICWYLNTRFD